MAEQKGLAVVTGASSGIGLELARCCAEDGYDLLIAADESEIEDAARSLGNGTGRVDSICVDLATANGVDELVAAIGDRPVDLLLANAGRGLGHAFIEQDLHDIRRVIDTNVTGTVMLTHKILPTMLSRDRGRILFTGSIAGYIPGSYQAVYNATKAFVDSFSFALRNELKDTNISVTCLMPGPTETEFFKRADMEGTPVGSDPDKSDAATVAREGYDAMMKGEGGTVPGYANKLQVAMSGIVSQDRLAEQHRKLAQPKGE